MNALSFGSWLSNLNFILADWRGITLEHDTPGLWSEWYAGVTPRDYAYAYLNNL